MDKKIFIEKMLVKYMSKADTMSALQVKDELEKFLPANIDFDYLYEKIITEYKQFGMPNISWMKDFYRSKDNSPTNSLYWKATVKTSFGIYDFAIEMRYTEEEINIAYRKKGWTFIKGNRREIMIENGLI